MGDIRTIIVEAKKYEKIKGATLKHLEKVFYNIYERTIMKKKVYVITVDLCRRNDVNYRDEYAEDGKGYDLFCALEAYEIE